MRLHPPLFAAIFFVASALTANADSILGSQVTVTVDSPILGNARSVPATATVGSGIEFPSGSLELASMGVPTGTHIIGTNIDLSATQIAFDYTQFATATSATFNGYVFNFSGLPSDITGVSLDPASTFTAAQVPLGFGPDDVTVNVQGLGFNPSSRILVDIDFASAPPSAVPEPSTIALLGTGILGLAGAIRRKLLQP